MLHRTHLFIILLFALATIGNRAPIWAQEQNSVVLRLSHWVARTHPFHDSVTVWSRSVAEASRGSIAIQIVGEEALGSARDHYAMVRDGLVDLAFVNPAFDADRFPLFSAGELPLMVSDPGRGSRSFDRWYRTHAKREMHDVRYCLSFLFGPGTLHSKRPVAIPNDVAGLRVRTAHAGVARYIENLESISVPGRISDAHSIITTGLADAITLSWDSLFIFRLDALLKYHVEIPLYVTPFALLMNRAAFERLAQDQRQLVDAHCATDWAERIGTDFAASQLNGLARLHALSEHVVIRPTPAQRELWMRSTAKTQWTWIESKRSVAQEAEQALAEYRSLLKSDGALFE